MKDSIDAPIYACGCCGYRQMDVLEIDSGKSFKFMSLDDLDLLHLDEDQEENHIRNIKELGGIELPCDSAGHTKSFQLWKAWSIYPQRKLEKGEEYFALNPELVQESNPRTNSKRKNGVWICSSCCRA